MLFEQNMKLADVIHHDYNLVPVLSRFGIFLGFGDTNIENICKEKNINTDFFLSILNSFHDSRYADQKSLRGFPSSMVIDYLRKTHKYYLLNKIPEIERLITQMIQAEEINRESYSLLNKFFLEYKNELIKHVDREENIIFPYVLELEEAINNDVISEKLNDKIEKHPISCYYDEHEDVEEKLTDLKNILIKYLPPSLKSNPNQQNRYKLVKELFVLEKDLNDHGTIEDLIMVPKVELMEQQAKKMYR